jgi:hypothetical protein
LLVCSDSAFYNNGNRKEVIMSEIEKMYRTAKVVPSHHYCNDCQYDMSAECPIRCPDNVAVYPPFTAEKQIELIKWSGKNKNGFNVFYDTSFNSKEKQYWCCADQHYEDFNYCCHEKEFDNALAGLINNLWQDLTEKEKQQVKGILE